MRTAVFIEHRMVKTRLKCSGRDLGQTPGCTFRLLEPGGGVGSVGCSHRPGEGKTGLGQAGLWFGKPEGPRRGTRGE